MSRDWTGFVIPKDMVEVFGAVVAIECGNEINIAYVQGKSVLDQLLEAGAVIGE